MLTSLADFFEEHVFQIVGSNDHLAYMSVKYGLYRYLFTPGKIPRAHEHGRNGPQFVTITKKKLADFMEALMGAIYRDRDGDEDNRWEAILIRFMKTFELDFGAALRYPRW